MQVPLGQSQSKPPFWSSGATGEFNPEKREWFSYKTNLILLLLSGKSVLPLLRLREPLNTALLTKAHSGTEKAFCSRAGLCHQECHLLCAQAARALTPVPITKQRVWNIQLYQTEPAFSTQTDVPAMAWISTSHKHLSNSHNQVLPSPIILQQGEWAIQIHVWNKLYLQWNGSRHHPFHVSVKQFVPSVCGLGFFLGFNPTNLSNSHFVGTAGGGSSREKQFSKLPWR